MNSVTLFGQTHGITILTLIILGGICIAYGRRGCTWPRAVLAFICLVIYPVNQIALSTLDFQLPLNNIIPGHLCDIAALTAGFGLLTGKPLLCELTYCWGLAGTIQGLITPNLPFDFPHPMFWSFFLQHGVIVIVALYLPLVMDWKPRPGIVPRILLWNQVYFLSALALNGALGTNFGFLLEKPRGASPLDAMGDWPIYLIWLQVLAAVLMTLLLLPFSKSINIWRMRRIEVSEPHE
ncbi:TIGR02206 family membrane protein [Verrucomicrobiaceae bacterium 227]